MEIRELDSPVHFLANAAPVLDADEARHNLLFGICSTLIEAPDTYPVFLGWIVEDAGEPVAAALRTPPWNLALAAPLRKDALELLAGELHAAGNELPGVTAALPEADAFAQAWAEVSGASVRERMRQGIYAAREGRPPEGVPGRMRMATKEDREVSVALFQAFIDESLHEDLPRHDTEAAVERRIASPSSGIALWDDDGLVSLSGYGGRTPHGVRIGPVYTPPELRRRGYASALVGVQTAHLLAGEADFCFLYTDLANPTSNRIYRNVGYELVCESRDYAFDD